jgi:hypothetical protein
MSPQDALLATQWSVALVQFDAQRRRLPGIGATKSRACFVAQLVESDRRVRYVAAMRQRRLSHLRKDPASELFDPVLAAILHQQAQDLDEASWLVFLSVHFGKAPRSGWALVRDIYGALGCVPWTWPRVSASPQDFRIWLDENIAVLKVSRRRFGNHRKYQSLDAWSPNGTGDAVDRSGSASRPSPGT